jgi:TM2 domain-containing membrane protein YozV
LRSTGIAYLLWFFFGVCGVHRFYCGRVGTGILWFFTGGLFLIGWLVDAFLIPDMVREANAEHASYQRGFRPYDPLPSPHPTVAQYAGTAAPSQPPDVRVPTSNKVVYCTQCGSAMQVPGSAGGAAYACPTCRTVLQIPV